MTLLADTGLRAKAVMPIEIFLAKQVDYAGRNDFQPVYEGWAEPGTATSAASWIIKKNTYNSDGSFSYVQWADGNINNDNVWDNRASLTYS